MNEVNEIIAELEKTLSEIDKPETKPIEKTEIKTTVKAEPAKVTFKKFEVALKSKRTPTIGVFEGMGFPETSGVFIVKVNETVLFVGAGKDMRSIGNVIMKMPKHAESKTHYKELNEKITKSIEDGAVITFAFTECEIESAKVLRDKMRVKFGVTKEKGETCI